MVSVVVDGDVGSVVCVVGDVVAVVDSGRVVLLCI